MHFNYLGCGIFSRPEGEETKPQDEEANQPPKEENHTKPVDKDELTDNLAAIVQTAKFGKMWKEKLGDNKPKPAKNAIAPVEEVPKREKEYYEPHKDFAPTKKHWWEIAEQPKKVGILKCLNVSYGIKNDSLCG